MNYKIIGISLIISSLLFFSKVYAQEYENGSIDMGVGAIISVGLQEEWGFDIRLQYTNIDKKKVIITEYNRYFIRQFENTEVYNELMASYNHRLLHWNGIDITGGLGYVANDYEVSSRAADTSNLFFETGKFSHGVLLKLRGIYQLSEPVYVFAEVNMKSFGRRYDTFAFGLTYALGI